jgi:hypothetical protein
MPLHQGTTRHRPTNRQQSKPGTGPVCSPAAAHRPATATSTTASPGRKADPPQIPRPRLPPQPHQPPPQRKDLPADTARRLPMDQPPRPPLHHQRQTPVTVSRRGRPRMPPIALRSQRRARELIPGHQAPATAESRHD